MTYPYWQYYNYYQQPPYTTTPVPPAAPKPSPYSTQPTYPWRPAPPRPVQAPAPGVTPVYAYNPYSGLPPVTPATAEPNWNYQKRYEAYLKNQPSPTPTQQPVEDYYHPRYSGFTNPFQPGTAAYNALEAERARRARDLTAEFEAATANEPNWNYQKRYEHYLWLTSGQKPAAPAPTGGGGGGYGGGGYGGGGGRRTSQYIPQPSYGGVTNRPTYPNMPDIQGWLYNLVTWNIGK